MTVFVSENLKDLGEMIESIAISRGYTDDQIQDTLDEAEAVFGAKMAFSKVSPKFLGVKEITVGEFEVDGETLNVDFDEKFFDAVAAVNNEVGKTILPDVEWNEEDDPIV